VALDESFNGRVYPPSPTFEVSREKIREFADAIGDPSPVYRDPEAAQAAGYPDVIAPPTFAVIISLKANDVIVNDPDLGLDYSRVVHGDQSFVHHRSIRAGDRLVAVAHVDNVMTRAGNDILSVRAELGTENGEPVTTARATLVSRGTAEPAKQA
jgi:acyl dehydratase